MPMRDRDLDERLAEHGVAQAFVERDHVFARMEVHLANATLAEFCLEGAHELAAHAETLMLRRDRHLEQSSGLRALWVKQHTADEPGVMERDQVKAVVLERKGHVGALVTKRSSQHAIAELELVCVSGVGRRDQAKIHGSFSTRRLVASKPSARGRHDDSAWVDHPLVLTHPETGIKGLYLTSRITHLLGIPRAESDALLAFLRQHASGVNYQYRNRWNAGDLVIWDNRAVWHYAVDDYGDHERWGLKISIEGGNWRPA